MEYVILFIEIFHQWSKMDFAICVYSNITVRMYHKIMYGGYSEVDRQLIYSEISNALTSFSSPMMLMGDFNEILEINERKGQSNVTRGMRDLQTWIEHLILVDVPLNG